MPFLDEKTKSIYIRVVYDGAPESGKTTNLEKLTERVNHQRRGKMHSPGTTSNKRTVYFDWLDVTGGYVEGRRLRCQLVSVPGQVMLAARRAHLLETADVVVFVADSRRSELDRNREMISDLKDRLGKRTEGVAPVSIMLQANKQDFDDAMEPRELARALGLGPIVPVHGAVASETEGVLEVFMLAVRLAADRVRTYLLNEKMTHATKESLSHEHLLEQMQQIDLKLEDPLEKLVSAAARATVDSRDAEGSSESQNIPAVARERESNPDISKGYSLLADEALTRAEQEVGNNSNVLPVSKKPSAPGQIIKSSEELVESNIEDKPEAEGLKVSTLVVPVDESAPPFPQEGIPAGFLWPPVTSRAVLSVVDSETKRAVLTPGPWCPRGWLEWMAGDDWVLHTHKAGVSDLSAGRALLMDTLRLHSHLGRNLPEGRSIALTEDGSLWRLWIVSPNLETFDKTLSRLSVGDNVHELIDTIQRVVSEVKLLCEKAADKRVSLTLELCNIALTRESVVYLGEVRAIAGNRQNNSLIHLLEELNDFLLAHPDVKAALPPEVTQALIVVSTKTS